MSPKNLCELLGVRHPVLLAGMGGIADKHLVAAVSKSGGFGTWGSAVDVKNKGPVSAWLLGLSCVGSGRDGLGWEALTVRMLFTRRNCWKR